MAQRSVWLRRDPVGSRTRLPSRDEFRGRFAQRALVLGPLALSALAVLVGLRSQDRWPGAWPWLLAAVFWLGAAGIGAAAIASRTPRFRVRALAGAGSSLIALTGALYAEALAASLR